VTVQYSVSENDTNGDCTMHKDENYTGPVSNIA